MRIALTIILNGLHHLNHNNYYKTIIDSIDHWVIVEGASDSTGSTSWCNKMPIGYHNNGYSIDGTTKFLKELAKNNKKVIYIEPVGIWKNKDVQINAGVSKIKEITDECYLWQIDIDEQWSSDQFNEAEKALDAHNAKTGCFLCDYYVGKNLIAKGQWGEGNALPWRRLWKWSGEDFESHEPPRLKGGNGKGILIPIRFKHYAYYFKEDVQFKDKWYTGHRGVYDRWKALQKQNNFPVHISALLGTNTHWGNTNTIIEKT